MMGLVSIDVTSDCELIIIIIIIIKEESRMLLFNS